MQISSLSQSFFTIMSAYLKAADVLRSAMLMHLAKVLGKPSSVYCFIEKVIGMPIYFVKNAVDLPHNVDGTLRGGMVRDVQGRPS